MSTNYTGTPGNISPNLSVPLAPVVVDGDPDSAATFAGAFQLLLDFAATFRVMLLSMLLRGLRPVATLPSAQVLSMDAAPGYWLCGLSAATNAWAYSTDGMVWTSGGGTSALWPSVLYVPSLNLFVAITQAGTTVGLTTFSAPSLAMTGGFQSPTGSNTGYANRTIPSTVGAAVSVGQQSLTFGAGLIVAAPGNTGQVISSPDGVTWTARGAAVMTGKVMSRVAYLNSLFLAAANDGTLFTSTDGITWTSRGVLSGASTANPNASQAVIGFAYSARAGVFIVGVNTSSGATVLSSPDGTTWTLRYTIPNPASAGTAYVPSPPFVAGNTFIQAASAGNVVLFFTSVDGITWVQDTQAAGFANVNAIAYVRGERLLVAANNGVLYSSPSLPGL